MGRIRTVVLMGGTSAEREVSLRSGQMAIDALNPDTYDAAALDTGQPDWIAQLLSGPRPDVAVIILHGPGGEDGVVQGLLQSLGIPFTGSGVMSSALCMDKELTKLVLRSEGIPVPQSFTLTAGDWDRTGMLELVQDLPLPMVIKPNRQGSTRGASKVTRREEVLPAIAEGLKYDTSVLLEEFVTGMEITACVLGGNDLEVLPLIEIVPQSGFYDYHDKYTPGATDEIIPARIPQRRAEEARKYALQAHRRLKCWGMSRTDMIVGETETRVLEVNTIPGLTATSLLPLAASAAGISMADLLGRLIDLARQRPEG